MFLDDGNVWQYGLYCLFLCREYVSLLEDSSSSSDSDMDQELQEAIQASLQRLGPIQFVVEVFNPYTHKIVLGNEP